jgi:uncharacterized repeat protein (TIGR03803 family)
MTRLCSCWRALLAILLVCAATAVPSPAQSLSTLVSFNNTNGANPLSVVIQGLDGYLYGTSQLGGQRGYGNIFKISTDGVMTEFYGVCQHRNLGTPLYFCTDGAYPTAGLVLATDGNLYGVTSQGGTNCSPDGCGTIFRITPLGVLTTLYNFCSQANCTDGTTPNGALIQANDGNLYGTTSGDGHTSFGSVFRLSLNGTLTTLYNFSGPDGAAPHAPLTQGMDEALYGTTIR